MCTVLSLLFVVLLLIAAVIAGMQFAVSKIDEDGYVCVKCRK